MRTSLTLANATRTVRAILGPQCGGSAFGFARGRVQTADLEFRVFPPATARLFQDGSPLPSTRVENSGPGERLRV